MQPGADASQLRWRYDGAQLVQADAQGNLVVALPAIGPLSATTLTEQAPRAWQVVAGQMVPVTVSYRVASDQRISFALGAYDRSLPLIIDPTLVYSTYLSGNNSDYGYGIAVDSAGNSYVVGSSSSSDFPTQAPIYTLQGQSDIVATKIITDGVGLAWSTFLGTTSADYGFGIALDSTNNVYVTGYSNASGFPDPNNKKLRSFMGSNDGIVAALNAAGTQVLFSTYLGGSGSEAGNSIAVRTQAGTPAQQRIGVLGYTFSGNFPTTPAATSTNGISGTLKGTEDAFVTQLTWNGTTLSYVYSTYYGGSVIDEGKAIALDNGFNALITGRTSSGSGFPLRNSTQATLAGSYDVFLARLRWTGSTSLLSADYSTYYGGTGSDNGYGLAASDDGQTVWITGNTASSFLPGPASPVAFAGSTDAFVLKATWSGSSLSYQAKRYLGGTSGERGNGIALDAGGNAYVVGQTSSTDFPLVGSQQTAMAGISDVFVTRVISTGTQLTYSIYMGGTDGDYGNAIAVHGFNVATITGETASATFPISGTLSPYRSGSVSSPNPPG